MQRDGAQVHVGSLFDRLLEVWLLNWGEHKGGCFDCTEFLLFLDDCELFWVYFLADMRIFVSIYSGYTDEYTDGNLVFLLRVDYFEKYRGRKFFD